MKRRALRGTMPSHSMRGAPCTWQRKPSLAYSSARTMPDLASRNEARTSWVLFPMEETMPFPVTTTRRIETPSPCLTAPARSRSADATPARAAPRGRAAVSGYCRLLPCLEQADAQVGGRVDDLTIGLHDAVGNRQLELAQDHPLEIDDVLQRLGRRQDHAGELHLAHAQGPAAPRGAEPAEEEARQLPQPVEAQTPGHDGIALEVTGPYPVEGRVAGNLELGHDLALAMGAAVLRDTGDALEHQHGRQWQLGVAGAEQLTAPAGQQVGVLVARRALVHCPLGLLPAQDSPGCTNTLPVGQHRGVS